jgi:pimeloyl-ACP methyl ester carboxylesterase
MSVCLRRAALAGFMLALAATVATADVIVLKDGFVLQGKVKRETALEFDKVGGEMIAIPKGFFMIDDGPRRVYFSPGQVASADKKDPPNEERILAKYSKLQVNPRNLPPLLGVLKAPEWDEGWERQITIQAPDGPKTLPQHLGMLTPYWARADSMGKFFWSCGYLTRELGPEKVAALLATHPDFQEGKEAKDGKEGKEKEAARATRRFRLVDFYGQTGWYSNAEHELDLLLRDMPDQKERVEAARGGLARMKARELFEEIKRLHQAGQVETVRKRLKDFPEKDASEPMVADLREIRSEDAATVARRNDAIRLLDEARRGLTGPDADALGKAAEALLAELKLGPAEILPRLDTFLGQARQAERQRKAGKGADATPADQLVSLAVSGWLVGTGAAETNAATALRFWRARQMVLSYLRATEVERPRILAAYQKEARYEASMEEILQIIPQLPPAEPLEKPTTEVIKLQVPAGRQRITYHLQLPPEYRPTRSYPVLIVLHQGGEKAEDMLKRWETGAAENGYVLVAPEWEKAANGKYNYTEDDHATVLTTLRDLWRRVQIDTDRVFLFGLGEGGTMAFDVGLAHPDLFAGVIPMGGELEKFSRACWRNAQYVPFYVVSGNKAGPAEDAVRNQFDNWILRNFPALWVDYKGRGVEWFAGEVPNVFDWMRPKHRAFPLQQLGYDGNGGIMGKEFCTMRHGDNRFYWVSTDAIGDRHINDPFEFKNRMQPATMTARVDPQNNEIYVRTSGLAQVTVWLSRSVRGAGTINFDKPVTVRVNLAPAWNNRKITPSLAVLLEDLALRGDRQTLFVAKVAVNLK